MTTEQQPDETAKDSTIDEHAVELPAEPVPQTSMVPATPVTPATVVSVAEPTPPAGMSAEDVTALRSRVRDAVEQLASATGSKEMEVVDSITAVGIQTQRQAGSEMELLRARVGDMISQEGASGQI